MTEVSPSHAAAGSALSDSHAARRWRWYEIVALCLLLIVAADVRARCAEFPSFDELWHLALTKGWGSPLGALTHDEIHREVISQTSLEGAMSLVSVWRGMRDVLHPPLYVVLLRGWREVFGESDFAAQTLSIAASLVSITFCYLTAQLAMNRRVALLGAMALAFAQTQVYFAQEIRSYAMLAALGSVALWMMTYVEVNGPTRGRAVGLAMLSLLIVLTHYFGAGAAAAIFVHSCLRLGRHRRAFLLALGVAALFFAVVWLPEAIAQLSHLGTGDALLYRPDVSTLERLALVLGVPFRLLAERDYQLERTPLVAGVMFFVPWLLVRQFRAILPWALWLCLSVAPVLLLDLTRSTVHLAVIRYVAVATPAVPLLFAGVAWAVDRRLAYVCAAASVAVGAIYLISKNTVPIDSPDVSPIAGAIAAHARPGEPILTYEPPAKEWMSDVWIMTCSHEPGLFPRTIAELTKPMTTEMVRELKSESAWLVCHSLDRPLAEVIPGATLIDTYGSVPGVSVLHIALHPDATSGPATNLAR